MGSKRRGQGLRRLPALGGRHSDLCGDSRPRLSVERSSTAAPAATLPIRGFRVQPMPELPDISAYISALEPRIVGHPLERIRLQSAFLLRTAQPPLADAEGHAVRELRRIG